MFILGPQQPVSSDFPQNQLPALIIGGNMLPNLNETPAPPAIAVDNSVSTVSSGPEAPIKSTGNTVYQRIQTIQLTPQNQQVFFFALITKFVALLYLH